jgi:tripartite-type tricarboxylate transporter receptor subunit TctC
MGMRPLSALRAGLAAILAAWTVSATAAPASAQTFPSRTITLVVAYAAGGTGDLVARAVSDKLAAALGQSVVVENRAGAAGDAERRGLSS